MKPASILFCLALFGLTQLTSSAAPVMRLVKAEAAGENLMRNAAFEQVRDGKPGIGRVRRRAFGWRRTRDAAVRAASPAATVKPAITPGPVKQ